ncbi:MAG: DUF1559 domain-containing protein [Planctomycetaceae bacterium]|nr:DUF1559 domain-containing protein [Planctomycetaceae bacterium]
MGLGVHNFHDSQNAVVPSCIFNNRPSFWGLIYPFIEQNALYEILGSKHDSTVATRKAPLLGNSTTNTGQWFVRTLVEEERKAFGSVTIYKCPTRRSGEKYIAAAPEGSSNDNGFGPRGDYAIVSSQNSNGVSTGITAQWLQQVSLYGGDDVHISGRNSSPFRVSTVTWNDGTSHGSDKNGCRYLASWKPRDTFAWWQDGLSNQLIVGEKFIPQELIDYPVSTYLDSFMHLQWDGGYLNPQSDYFNANIARIIDESQACIKRSPNDIAGPEAWGKSVNDNPPNIDYREAVFGGIHPGVGQFLIGDGSVSSISVSVSQNILAALAKVNDGATASLP